MTIWVMRNSLWVPKALNCSSLPQWLHERASMLHYTYTDWLVIYLLLYAFLFFLVRVNNIFSSCGFTMTPCLQYIIMVVLDKYYCDSSVVDVDKGCICHIYLIHFLLLLVVSY
jgi:hypothetical protein